MFELTQTVIDELLSIDTPTVCNALEVLVPERRGFGYTTDPLVCTRPDLRMVGIARTATIRSAHPSTSTADDARRHADAYYEYIDSGAKPSVIVMQDVDTQRGYGSFWGEVNSSIHLGLGCVGVVTDGGVRDIPDIAPGFQMLADRIIPSLAFVHVVEFGRPVTVAGMHVADGDLIHADLHGAVVIPHDVAAQVLEAAQAIQRFERVIIEAARRPGFDIHRLREAQGRAAEIH